MQRVLPEMGPPLPEVLRDDLEELLTWDNNCFLTWNGIATDADPTGSRWFTVRLSSDGRQFGLRLEFWIPTSWSQRGIAAILPAHLSLFEFREGEMASVDLGMGRWSALEASIPKVARTCARLINELWGRTEADEVLLLTIDYQELVLDTPFQDLASYGK